MQGNAMTPGERGKRMLRECGYARGGHVHEDAAEDKALIKQELGKARIAVRKSGGHVHGEAPKGRPDRRARGGVMKRDDGGPLYEPEVLKGPKLQQLIDAQDDDDGMMRVIRSLEKHGYFVPPHIRPQRARGGAMKREDGGTVPSLKEIRGYGQGERWVDKEEYDKMAADETNYRNQGSANERSRDPYSGAKSKDPVKEELLRRMERLGARNSAAENLRDDPVRRYSPEDAAGYHGFAKGGVTKTDKRARGGHIKHRPAVGKVQVVIVHGGKGDSDGSSAMAGHAPMAPAPAMPPRPPMAGPPPGAMPPHPMPGGPPVAPPGMGPPGGPPVAPPGMGPPGGGMPPPGMMPHKRGGHVHERHANGRFAGGRV